MTRTPQKPLTDTQIKNLKHSAKNKPIPDGNGLFIYPQKNSKVWLFSYIHPTTKARITKKRIGFYPALSLADARNKVQELKIMLSQGIDPFEHMQKQAEQAQREAETLEEFAEKWARWKIAKGRVSEKTQAKAMQRLKNHLFPRFKGYTLADFTITDTIEKLEPLQEVQPDTLYRITGNLIEIFNYAHLCGRVAYNPVLALKEAFSYREATHQPTISPDKLGAFLKSLQKSNRTPQVKLLIEWQLLTMLCPFEAVAVQWNDIDWEEFVLTIPAERMKGGKRSHSLPLSRQAVAILEEMKKYNGHLLHIFAGRIDRQKPVSSQTVNHAIKHLEGGAYKGILTAHGLRSIASTYLHDKFSEETLVIEACLSHVDKNTVRRTYNRGNFINRRRKIMQQWADFVEDCKKSA